MSEACRECGDCRVCCITPEIVELAKPPGKRCQNLCSVGCSIHEHKPAVCSDFLCAWRVFPDVPDDWRPDRIGLLGIIGLTAAGKRAIQFIPLRGCLAIPAILKELRRLLIRFDVWVGLSSGEWPPSRKVQLNSLPNRNAWRKLGAMLTQ